MSDDVPATSRGDDGMDPAVGALADGGEVGAGGGALGSPGGAGVAPEASRAAAVLRGLREGRAHQAVLAALVAWTITVAPAAFARGASASARAMAVLAVLCGVMAPPLAIVRRRLARHLGISLFLALVTLTWLLSSPAIQPSRLDPVRAATGAVAWGVFALSWRDRWPTGRQASPDPDAPVLLSRSRLPPFAAVLAAAGALAGVGILLVAWRVREPDRALLAQAAAVTCAVALVTVSATVAVGRGRPAPPVGRRLTQHAVRPLLLLIAFALTGAIVLMVR